MNVKVDNYISNAKKWQKETEKLRKIILECGLTEELKWGKPCYLFQQTNLIVIQGFKEYCALLFFKGVLLKDDKAVLIKTGINTRVGRQIRFTGIQEIIELQPVIIAYIHEAIELEKAGIKADAKEKTPLTLPEELQQKLHENPALKTAFDALTPGRQRAYSFYFSAPKQSATRLSRIEKCMQQILQGKGLNDR